MSRSQSATCAMTSYSAACGCSTSCSTCRDITGFIAAHGLQWGLPNSDGPLWGSPEPYLGREVVAAYTSSVSAYIGMLR